MSLGLNYNKLSKEFPDAVAKIGKSQSIQRLIQRFEQNGVRVYLGYGASGGHVPTVYRKKTVAEFKKDSPNKSLDLNWEMTRIGIIQSYNTRELAYKAGFEEAFNQLQYLIDNVS
jgi:hypothetical protein